MKKVKAGGLVSFKEFEAEFVNQISASAVRAIVENISINGVFAQLRGQANRYLNSPIGAVFPGASGKGSATIELPKNKTCQVTVHIQVSNSKLDSALHKAPGYRFVAKGASSKVVRKKGDILVVLNGHAPLGAILENAEEVLHGIRFVVSHEMTHIKGFVSKKEARVHRQMGDLGNYINSLIAGGYKIPEEQQKQLLKWNRELFRAYFNSPSEFKSRQREIIENIAMFNILKLRGEFATLKVPEGSSQTLNQVRTNFILELLNNIAPWREAVSLMTPKNRRDLLRNVYMFLAGKDFILQDLREDRQEVR